ncbi:c-type cytochrome biogenesis protein CcmI [uncultured Roseovarius sp.]|uniref:c-type cytochrome biogenesis protein CcmI n=1 Tax=uncultured Roseovarius sp. TaxID=293344 RepID=UPI00262E2C5E|nr:c-type cytochrome biogenesis protein CcmI [uncultured Roseovarius sp.]
MTFWIIIGSLALGVGGVLALALLRGRKGAIPPAAYDLQVYRDQLKEVDRDLARGVIAEADAERVRTEVSRRVLAADANLRAQQAADGRTTGGNAIVALALIAVMLGGSVALYARLGAPGYGDLPLEARIAASEQARTERASQSEAEARAPARPPVPEASADYLALMEKLRQTVKDRPGDLRGLRLLVRNEAALGNITAAYTAQAKVIEVKGPEATADDHALMADLMIAAAGGYVSTEAEAALRMALQRDPDHPTSRYYLGSFLMQVDRPDAAFRTWEQLLRESPPDAPWVAPIRNQIEEVAWRAGVKYELPQPVRGPSAEDVEAAGEMNAEDRDQMIRGMVQNLSDRLASDGGSPEEWARLIAAYGVLGEVDQARAIWTEAQQVFAGKAEALAQVRSGAEQAGVAE